MSEVDRFLDRHVAEVEPLYLDYNRSYWTASISGKPEDAAVAAKAKEKLMSVYARPDECAEVGRLAASGDPDPVKARQLELLRLEYDFRRLDPAVLADIVRREEEIETTFNTFRAELDGRKVTENDIKMMLREETDVPRRKAAWEASKQIGAALRDRIVALVEVRNREARRLGHRDFYAMSLAHQELDETELFGVLDRLKTLSEEPFTRLKAEIDAALAARYGLAEFTPHPWMYSDPFFQETPPGLARIDLNGVFKDKDIEALTLRTFADVGLPVDDLFPRSDFYEKDGKCQHAFCMDVDRKGDVRVLCNVKPDAMWMSTMLHEFGHAVYDRYTDPAMPFLLRQPAHIMTTEAIAMLFGRMTHDPGWLHHTAGVSEEEAKKLHADIARALRFSQIIFVRWGLLLVHFEREMYRDPAQDLNALWWRMVAEYQHVTPPPGRDSADWASKIHLSIAPVYYQNYLFGEMTASQLEAAIRKRIGGNGSLATISGQAETGAFLRERIFEPGAAANWQDTLKAATGEPLDPEHFLRQFVYAS